MAPEQSSAVITVGALAASALFVASLRSRCERKQTQKMIKDGYESLEEMRLAEEDAANDWSPAVSRMASAQSEETFTGLSSQSSSLLAAVFATRLRRKAKAAREANESIASPAPPQPAPPQPRRSMVSDLISMFQNGSVTSSDVTTAPRALDAVQDAPTSNQPRPETNLARLLGGDSSASPRAAQRLITPDDRSDASPAATPTAPPPVAPPVSPQKGAAPPQLGRSNSASGCLVSPRTGSEMGAGGAAVGDAGAEGAAAALVGRRVVITSLISAEGTLVNGKKGTVLSVDADGRCTVAIHWQQKSGKPLVGHRLPPSCLSLVAAESSDESVGLEPKVARASSEAKSSRSPLARELPLPAAPSSAARSAASGTAGGTTAAAANIQVEPTIGRRPGLIGSLVPRGLRAGVRSIVKATKRVVKSAVAPFQAADDREQAFRDFVDGPEIEMSVHVERLADLVKQCRRKVAKDWWRTLERTAVQSKKNPEEWQGLGA